MIFNSQPLMMKRFCNMLLIGTLMATPALIHAQDQSKKTPESSEIWEPQPKKITSAAKPGDAPSDALILFDGKNLDNWVSDDGTAPKWTVQEGTVTVAPNGKDIKTKKEFTDFQLHIEWRTPAQVDSSKKGQQRGNSGIFLQDRYEIQVLDNYNNKTYANGQASSVYKQHIPLANACRKPGEWQTYEIFFTAPRFSPEGRVITPAYVTVVHNGVLTLNHVAIWGPTEYIGLPVYKPYEKGPIRLQDHGNPVSFRNIWIREL
jgi:hypothetical protein